MVRKDHWMDHASCAGVPEIQARFFGHEGIAPAESHYRDAKQMCDACPVARHCRLASIGEADGLWALLTANNRVQFRSIWGITDPTGGLAAEGHRRAQVAWVYEQDPVDAAVEWLGPAAGRAWLDWYAPTLSKEEYLDFYGGHCDRQSA